MCLVSIDDVESLGIGSLAQDPNYGGLEAWEVESIPESLNVICRVELCHGIQSRDLKSKMHFIF